MEINQNHSGIGHNVVNNFAPPTRHMNSQLESQIDERIPVGSKVNVFSNMGDGESLGFANEICAYLISKGYEVNPGQQTTFPPIYGQQLNVDKNGVYTISVGFRPQF